MSIRVRSVLLGLGVLVVVAVFGALTAVGWEVVLGPNARMVTDRTFEATEARLARGRYLVEGPAACFHCHSEHDFSTPEYPVVAAKRGAGWELPVPELGRVYTPNITSDPETGLGAWTDDEIARAIQEGVGRDGRALFPIMPWMDFAELDAEDVASIVVYLRTVPPVRHEVPVSQYVFPLNFIVNTIPEPLTEPRASHPSSTPAERGAYLANMAGCSSCHTPTDAEGIPIPGMALGGGAVFKDPGQDMREVFSMNVTPDPSGIAHYDADFFVSVLQSGQIAGRTLNHIMPFEFFRNMTGDDLRDLFAHLQTVAPVRHRVSNTDAPVACAVCGQRHGLGELNQAR